MERNNLIREIDDGKHVITHSWYVDDLGIKKNSLVVTNKASGTVMPIHFPLRVRDYPSSIDDDTSPLTDNQYRSLLKENTAH